MTTKREHYNYSIRDGMMVRFIDKHGNKVTEHYTSKDSAEDAQHEWEQAVTGESGEI